MVRMNESDALSMQTLLPVIPSHIETERLFLRCYQADDGSWYHAMSQKNKSHLAQYESENAVMRINTEAEAEMVVRGFAQQWRERTAFFMAASRQDTLEFVAQIYIGVVSWDLPEFEIGYFVDKGHEGKGYVTEAASGALRFAFEHLKAHRVRLECDDTNVRSYRVAERCGMVREGHIRENKKHANGSISGTYYYGLLRSEFFALHNLLI
jgi:aminoglycoside 6'-N-acetyltransferase